MIEHFSCDRTNVSILYWKTKQLFCLHAQCKRWHFQLPARLVLEEHTIRLNTAGCSNSWHRLLIMCEWGRHNEKKNRNSEPKVVMKTETCANAFILIKSFFPILFIEMYKNSCVCFPSSCVQLIWEPAWEYWIESTWFNPSKMVFNKDVVKLTLNSQCFDFIWTRNSLENPNHNLLLICVFTHANTHVCRHTHTHTIY